VFWRLRDPCCASRSAKHWRPSKPYAAEKEVSKVSGGFPVGMKKSLLRDQSRGASPPGGIAYTSGVEVSVSSIRPTPFSADRLIVDEDFGNDRSIVQARGWQAVSDARVSLPGRG
jgi:hypothetical protein